MTQSVNLAEKNWSDIKAASGSAWFVPGTIAKLTSEDPKHRHDARFTLDNEAVRQSDLYEAAAYCIGPLVQVLHSKPKHGRTEIYSVLIEIADGYAPPVVTVVTKCGEAIGLKTACIAQLRLARAVFERDLGDGQIGELANELLDAIKTDEQDQVSG